jgi:ubiquinone/menaquinone biosynthesis C-methylase UbiE
LNRIDLLTPVGQVDTLSTVADRTRLLYDRVAVLYPLSTYFFHSRAHRRAVEVSGIRDGMRVLEVATGSGEMFRRLVQTNRTGTTIGIDISPNMAARTQRQVLREFPGSRAACKAVDARYMPFPDRTFDAIVCCYLLELLSSDDIVRTLHEFRRVLRNSGRMTLILIGQDKAYFNRLYKTCGKLVPAFWGRQVEQRVPALIEAQDFRIVHDDVVRQTFYPSRVLAARKTY